MKKFFAGDVFRFRELYELHLGSVPKFFYEEGKEENQVRGLFVDFHFKNTDMTFKVCTKDIQPLVKDFREAMCVCAHVLAKPMVGSPNYQTVPHLVLQEFIDYYGKLDQSSLLVVLDQLTKRLALFKALFVNRKQVSKAEQEIAEVVRLMEQALQLGTASVASVENIKRCHYDSALSLFCCGSTYPKEIWKSEDKFFNDMCDQMKKIASEQYKTVEVFQRMPDPKDEKDRLKFLIAVEQINGLSRQIADHFRLLNSYAQAHPQSIVCNSTYQRDENLKLISENVDIAMPLAIAALNKHIEERIALVQNNHKGMDCK